MRGQERSWLPAILICSAYVRCDVMAAGGDEIDLCIISKIRFCIDLKGSSLYQSQRFLYVSISKIHLFINFKDSFVYRSQRFISVSISKIDIWSLNWSLRSIYRDQCLRSIPGMNIRDWYIDWSLIPVYSSKTKRFISWLISESIFRDLIDLQD